VRVAGKRTALTAVSSGPVRGTTARARGSAGPTAPWAARRASRLAGASGTTGTRLAALAVLSALSARRVECEAGAVQGRVSASAALCIRHGRTAAAAAAPAALADHHGQHDCLAVRVK
jgi:hypothetical protein